MFVDAQRQGRSQSLARQYNAVNYDRGRYSTEHLMHGLVAMERARAHAPGRPGGGGPVSAGLVGAGVLRPPPALAPNLTYGFVQHPRVRPPVRQHGAAYVGAYGARTPSPPPVPTGPSSVAHGGMAAAGYTAGSSPANGLLAAASVAYAAEVPPAPSPRNAVVHVQNMAVPLCTLMGAAPDVVMANRAAKVQSYSGRRSSGHVDEPLGGLYDHDMSGGGRGTGADWDAFAMGQSAGADGDVPTVPAVGVMLPAVTRTDATATTAGTNGAAPPPPVVAPMPQGPRVPQGGAVSPWAKYVHDCRADAEGRHQERTRGKLPGATLPPFHDGDEYLYAVQEYLYSDDREGVQDTCIVDDLTSATMQELDLLENVHCE